MMKLIGSFGSPFVRKARIVLADKKIDYELVPENVWAPDTRIHTFNPLGKVPCLVMEDGEAVFDSRVICEYVDTLSPVGKLIPQSGRERVEVRCWEALADIAVGCALGYLDFRMPQLNWRESHPNLDKHFQKLSQRQSFIDTVPKD